jgi:hypothetical protein
MAYPQLAGLPFNIAPSYPEKKYTSGLRDTHNIYAVECKTKQIKVTSYHQSSCATKLNLILWFDCRQVISFFSVTEFAATPREDLVESREGVKGL